ncbi:glycerophosphodiester phosphodiesterase [bacterium]|nr:glycerophosphodiester phosphodiesterase [bacterium]
MVFGHRGAAGYEPENTLLSISKALALNTQWIELDVFNVQNELIVIHDERLERTTNGKGYVEKSSLKYLRSLNAGKDEKIPLLTEVIDMVDRRMGINIELKGARTAKLTAKLIERYVRERKWDYDQFLVSSFNHPELALFKSLLPHIKIGALIAHIPLDYAEFAITLGAYSIHVSLEFISQELVDDTHHRGMKFFVYTVNHPEDVSRMKALKVDGIYTDFPDILSSNFCQS